MKQIRIIALLALLSTLSSCIISNPKVLKPLTQYEDASGLRIPSGTMKMAGMFCNDDDDDMVKNISTIEMVQCEDSKDAENISKDIQQIASKRKLELLLSASSGQEKVNLFGIINKKGDTLKELMIEATEKKETSVIYIKGKINLAEMMTDEEGKSSSKNIFENVTNLSVLH